jgi:hypothetical protein
MDAEPFGQQMIPRPWLDPARDAVHLNWEPVADIDWQTYDLGDPVRYLLQMAALTKSGRASFIFEHLMDFSWRIDPDQPHWRQRWTRPEMVDMLRERGTWTVVVLLPIVIHADVATAAGLFGLLGDARVQVIEDEAEMMEYLALGEKPNVVIDDAFTMDEFHNERDLLRATAVDMLGTAVSEVALRPAVMFRLCPYGCK